MINKIKKIFLLGFVLLLSGCKMVVLDPKGIIAASEKQLLIDAVSLMLIIVIPVIVMTFVIAWRYRASNTKAKYSPNWAHSYTLEAVWWAIPCVIVVVLAVLTWVSTHKLNPYKPLAVKGTPITIQAVALDWRWLFIYPDKQIATVNYVEIPVNVPIRFLITADAPMNSFQIPQLAGQIYAMPGMQTKLHLMATSTGVYRGQATNFSGDGFSGMDFKVKVSSKKAFANWVNTVQHQPNQLTIAAYKRLALHSESHAIEYFSSPAKNLFQKVIMRYMKPGMENMGEPTVAVQGKKEIGKASEKVEGKKVVAKQPVAKKVAVNKVVEKKLKTAKSL